MVLITAKYSSIVKEFLALYQAKFLISIYCVLVKSSGSLQSKSTLSIIHFTDIVKAEEICFSNLV